MIKLDKPICFFDIESTGVNTASDRIITIAVIKLHPDGRREEKQCMMNPEIDIPPAATAIHGIKNADVLLKPKFSQYAKGIYEFMKDSDLAGFNSNGYDVPLLAEEFLRCNIDFPLADQRLIDAMTIFRKKERRDLAAAYKFFCGKEMANAHDASYDISVTLQVFEKQLERYPDLADMQQVADFCQDEKKADLAGKIGIDIEGDYIYNFGNLKGTKIIDDIRKNGKNAVAFWMLKKDFPNQTKRVLQRIITGVEPKKADDFHDFDPNTNNTNGQLPMQFKHQPKYEGEQQTLDLEF